ncbi:hypothetical protein ATI61_112100 [Archangium gephyra]|uniref:Uncharacterized protein n=1 Tax=Archangium gephyra TaxID=48 RepID=A0ABX9JS25_9BACT|nr:hypothetical protein [Archangium gephyra]REG26005.1 hypothetical protein ATI61_112100 [Archangium gephyra]
MGRLLGAARLPGNGFARWNGGYATDDFSGPLGSFVGVSEHAVSKVPNALTWDVGLAELPTQSFAFSLVNGDAYPFVFVGSAKVVVNETTGAPLLLLRNVVFVISTYFDSAKLKVSVDGIELFRLDNSTTRVDELYIPLTPGTTTRLSFDINALGRSEDVFNLAYNKDLSFRLLALDLAVEANADATTCGLR